MTRIGFAYNQKPDQAAALATEESDAPRAEEDEAPVELQGFELVNPTGAEFPLHRGPDRWGLPDFAHEPFEHPADAGLVDVLVELEDADVLLVPLEHRVHRARRVVERDREDAGDLRAAPVPAHWRLVEDDHFSHFATRSARIETMSSGVLSEESTTRSKRDVSRMSIPYTFA